MCKHTGFTLSEMWFVQKTSMYLSRQAVPLFRKVKVWGEIVEHEWGYRSQFAKIINLDYGDLDLLEKLRLIYGVNPAPVPTDEG
jgi:hypothetical protein